MECVEAAFIRKEMAMKPTQTPAAFVDDLWAVNVPNGDDFVDELLNFSNEEDEEEGEGEGGEEEGEGEEEEEEEEEEKQLVGLEEEDKQVPAVEAEQEVVVVVVEEHETNREDDKNSDLTTISSSFKDEFCSVPADDELASLEWVSHIVDDSNSEYSAPFPAGILPHEPLKESQTPPEPEKDSPSFKSLVPGKARSKRRRNGIWVSPLGSTTPLNESSSCSTTSSSSSSAGPWVANYSLPVFLDQVSFEKPRVKKQKRKPACDSDENVMPQPRRCSHCGVTKTPQWRAGPLGAKTLCNACGVRYKSGRLFPEYRPACSPTFSNELHSNHHRKVLEMRKKKEVMGGQLESGLAPSAVPSF